MQETSLFLLIRNAIMEDGSLPADFALPEVPELEAESVGTPKNSSGAEEVKSADSRNTEPGAADQVMSTSASIAAAAAADQTKATVDAASQPTNYASTASPRKVRFVVGAEDGIRIYHFGVTAAPDVAREVARIIRKDCKRSGTKPGAHLLDLVRTHTALTLIDDLIDDLCRDMRGVILSNFADYACRLAFDSTEKELVKLGIALMGMLDTEGEEEITNDLLTLAACDEFTLYVVIALQNRKDTDELVWQIARTAHGWGKIHAVERLEPSSPEIREWILRAGLENRVMNSYLALTVAEKGRLIEALRAETIDDEELFASIEDIVEALLDEGPVAGITVYEDREEALTQFLRHAAMREKSEDLRRIVRAIEGKIDALEFPTAASMKEHVREILG